MGEDQTVVLAAMSESLFSQSWYRVASLRPRLRSHVQIFHHSYRGEDWYIIQDRFTGRHHRFSPEAYQLIGLMDGNRTLGDIWQAACTALGDHMPTQDEVIGLLSKLFRSDLLQSSALTNSFDLQQRRSQGERTRLLSSLRSPMFVKIPILDPDKFLEKTMHLAAPFLGRGAACVWLLIVLFSLFLVPIHWTDLTNNFTDQILGLENLLILSLLFPILKICHEFGHAYMVKKWGGEVHEMGVLLLVFMPIPYMDASSSLVFRSKYRRMLVGGAGILIELFFAAMAFQIWLQVEPGAVRAAAYNVMLIAGISTLLFNGNPLLRFDAYYVLTDFLEIPNLGQRATRFLGYLSQRYLLGMKGLDAQAGSLGERFWLVTYGVLSFFYRIYISFKIILFVAGKFFFIGIVLALWAGFGMIILPVSKMMKFLVGNAQMKRKRLRIFMVLVLPVSILLWGTVFWPLPSFTLCEGVIWAPEESRVYTKADGFVAEILTPIGTQVERGTPLIRSIEPELETRLQILTSREKEYGARYNHAMRKDRTDAAILKEVLEQIGAEIKRVEEKLDSLTIYSGTSGQFIVQRQQDLVGTYHHRGTPVGYILDPDLMNIRVVVPQADIERVRSDIKKVEIRQAADINNTVPALVVSEIPAASNELPSRALSLEGGGRFALDPRETSRMKVLDQLFQFEINPLKPIEYRVDERVYVRFEHSPEPLGNRFYRAVRRLLLNRFSI